MNSNQQIPMEQFRQQTQMADLAHNVETELDQNIMDQPQFIDQSQYNQQPQQYQQQYQQPQMMQYPNQQMMYKKGFMDAFPQLLKEPLLIAIIVFIISLPQTRVILSKYISYLAVGEDGKEKLIGIMIKSILVAIIFMAVKKFILHH